MKENEKLQNIITSNYPTGSLEESFNFLNRVIARTVRVYVPMEDLYDGMIYVYDATPFTILE